MEAIAHDPKFAKKAGVPQKVGKDFANADAAAGKTANKFGARMERRKALYTHPRSLHD